MRVAKRVAIQRKCTLRIHLELMIRKAIIMLWIKIGANMIGLVMTKNGARIAKTR